MKPRNREINIFNISMLDVISGVLGAFLIIMIVLSPRSHAPAWKRIRDRKWEEAIYKGAW